MAQHNFVGKIGEDLAREYLKNQGYKILEQNYRTKYAEIDLVAEKSDGLFSKKSWCLWKLGQRWAKVLAALKTPLTSKNSGKFCKMLNHIQLLKIGRVLQELMLFALF